MSNLTHQLLIVMESQSVDGVTKAVCLPSYLVASVVDLLDEAESVLQGSRESRVGLRTDLQAGAFMLRAFQANSINKAACSDPVWARPESRL